MRRVGCDVSEEATLRCELGGEPPQRLLCDQVGHVLRVCRVESAALIIKPVGIVVPLGGAAQDKEAVPAGADVTIVIDICLLSEDAGGDAGLLDVSRQRCLLPGALPELAQRAPARNDKPTAQNRTS